MTSGSQLTPQTVPNRQKRLPFTRWIVLTLAVLGLSGCAIATPFKGPGYSSSKGVTASGSGPITIAITQAVLKDDGAKRKSFWNQVSSVEASLASQPGLIGYSLRRELIGDTSWTLTAWVDEDSLRAFIEDVPHQDAIRDGRSALAEARFVRATLARTDLPLSWTTALEILEQRGRWYR
jgi:hypothetical protein